MADLLQTKLKWFKEIRSDSLQETSFYLEFLSNPTKDSIGTFIHAISDPFSYAGSFNLFDNLIVDCYMNANLLTEQLISSSTGSNFPFKFVQLIDTNNVLAYYNNTTLNFFMNDKLLAHHSFFTDLAHVVYFKNSELYIECFVDSYENSDVLRELDSLITEADLEAEAQWEASTPDTKLYYPEPFIASPSFNHEEIWFIHILHYNYWLWFFFISLIMFYFITFINVVRWCNLRAKPKRETRGVSRSKCADLITACVPVSWAISIIISETVDATDYYDGFGTGEIVIGIRAYQWGWEYFYPKSIDLNYNVKPSYSTFIGNSLKYNNKASNDLEVSVLWKYYQSKNNTSQVNTPAHLLLSPSNSNKSLNNIDFSHIGNSVSKDTSAFKKIQSTSKLANNHVELDTAANNTLFRKINNLYTSNSKLDNDSYYYGSIRQHNFSSNASLLPMSTTLVDNTSFKNFFQYSLANQNSDVSTKGAPDKQFLAVDSVLNSSKPNNTQEYIAHNSMTSLLENGRLSSLNALTDKQNLSNSLKHIDTTKKSSYNNNLTTHYYDEFISTSQNNFFSWSLFNESTDYRFKDVNSNNLKFLSFEKNNRSVANQKLRTVTQNFGTTNGIESHINSLKGLDKNTIYLNSYSAWNSPANMEQLLSTTLTTLPTRSGVTSTSPYWDTLDYDRASNFTPSETPDILRSKEDMAPDYLFSSYWHSYWKNISLSNEYSLISKNLSQLESAYIPLISEYSEYDFRNWQALESLEDSLWESTYSSLHHEDYLDLKSHSSTLENFNKTQLPYNTNFRLENLPKEANSGLHLYHANDEQNSKLKLKSVSKPFLKMSLTQLPFIIYSEELLTSPSSSNLLNFSIYNNEGLFETVEDSYENLKNFKYIYTLNSQNIFLNSFKYISPTTYTTVLDAFRANYDEYAWNYDYEYSLTNSIPNNETFTNNLTNKIKLRSPAKNAIVNYNAIQKVYKSRFDDFRSNTDFKSFTKSYASYPFLIEEKTPYESMLGKNKESFFNINFYNTDVLNNYSVYLNIWNSNNTLFLDIPFLLSMKSDASRYLWFDWQSRWSSIEVQPSSIAKYSLAGLPYFSKTFEYSTQLAEELNDSENYLTKLSRARQNYMPNWSYSPYLYNKVSNWFNYKYSQFFFGEEAMLNTKIVLQISSGYWKPAILEGSNFFSKATSTPTYSSLNTGNKTTWTPISNLSGSYYTESILLDILSKREHLYRVFLKNKSNNLLLPASLTVSPNNSLLREVKSIYSFIDPTTYSSESSREFLYQNSNYLRYIFIKDFLRITNELHYQIPINFNLLSNYFVHIIGPADSYTSLGKNYDLYKSQYRPMRKGVTNMIRLQATNAIAMPTEIRLHILASSKDVIHSWAIPSAGIKIDCVPGYSSHRVAIFLVHGIFWGQCMEICGRYHHWMPIVVYFMKRDLFFLWCTHFMHYSTVENSFNMTDKQLGDYLRLVSFNKGTWINELDKHIK